jgi:tight adherence protein B
MDRLLARAVAAAACALAILVGAAGPALADDDQLTIGHVQPAEDGKLEVLVSVPAGVDTDDLELAVEGTALDDVEIRQADESGDSVRRTTVLAIDTSNSMANRGRIEAAKAAANLFLDRVPDDVYVGIVTFDSQVRTALEPTRDRDDARAVVDGLTLSLQTRLYDGVISAVDAAGKEGQRSLLVLSDGRDTSKTPEADVVQAIGSAQVLVDVVALDQGGDALQPLQAMATAGKGTVIASDAEALEAAFSREAEALSRQVLVSGTVPDSVTGDEGSVSVTLVTDELTLTAQSYTAIRAAGDTKASLPGPDGPTIDVPHGAMLAGVLGLGVAAMLLVLALVGAGRRDQGESAEERILAHGRGVPAGQHASGPRPDTAVLDSARVAAGRMLGKNRGLEQRIATRLEAAGSALKPAEWLLMHSAIVLLAGVVGVMLTGDILFTLLFMLGGYLVPRLWLGRRRKRRLKAFSSGLADTLQLIAGSLSAGLSLAQSLDTVVREGTEPIAGEFKRVLVESRLGVPMEECLESVAVRMDSKDFAWVVMAIRIQREVGGNLAELLTTVAATLREREYLRRQVASLAAEGKISAYILGGMPPAMVLYMLSVRRSYIMPLFTEPMGLMMLAGACLMLGLGGFLMSRIVKVEV